MTVIFLFSSFIENLQDNGLTPNKYSQSVRLISIILSRLKGEVYIDRENKK